MKTLFNTIFLIWKKIIYSFIAPHTIVLHQLHKENVLSVQRQTRLTFVKNYNRLWVIPLFFLSLMNCAYMSCTLFNSRMEIPILSPIIIFGEIFFYIMSSTIFSIKPVEIWLNNLTWTWTHNLGGIWNSCHCTSVLY